MRRKSRGRARCAISLSEPASSTPVGPPPMTTNVIQAATRLVPLALGLLEGEENAAAHLERVLDALHPGGVLGPVGVAEVVVLRSGRDDQMVVIDRVSIGELHRPPRAVDGGDLRQDHLGVASPTQDGADRRGHVARVQRCRRHLVDQRLKEVMVAAVDDCHPDVIAPAKELGRLETGETGPDNHHGSPVGFHRCPGCANQGTRSQRVRVPMVLNRLSSLLRYAGMALWSIFWISQR